MTKKCNNVHNRTGRQKLTALQPRGRAYCGLELTAGEAGESVILTVVRLRPEGVSL